MPAPPVKASRKPKGGDRDENPLAANAGPDSDDSSETEDDAPSGAVVVNSKLVTKLRKQEALPESIKSDSKDLWRRVYIPTWYTFLGGNPNPFFVPNNVSLTGVQRIFEVVFSSSGINEPIPNTVNAIYHNVCILLHLMLLIQLTSFDRQMRAPETTSPPLVAVHSNSYGGISWNAVRTQWMNVQRWLSIFSIGTVTFTSTLMQIATTKR